MLAFQNLIDSKMAHSMEGSLLCRVQCALNNPLAQRCNELRKLFSECGFRDAHTLFPLVVESLFGFNGRPGWSLWQLHHHHQPREFDAVRSFLAPDGPLIELAYKLMNEIQVRYEFPVSCLPMPVIRSIEVGVIPPFYVGKLQTNSPGRGIANVLLLNPFEFFMFHLMYVMIRFENQKTWLDWNDASDPVYAFVVEDYLRHFMPLNGTYPPPPAHTVPVPVQVHSSSQHIRLVENHGLNQNLDRNPPISNLFNRANASITRQNLSSNDHQRNSSPIELWRTELFAQVLIELWLNHYGFEAQRNLNVTDKSRRFLSQSPSLIDRSWISSNDGSYNQMNSSNLSFGGSFFPSTYHVRLVRLFVKHTHYFVNSARPNSNEKFDVFKRALVPQLLSKKLYTFVRHLFNHWPLDASFRIVLELWLSYIQPWRYMIDTRSHNLNPPLIGSNQDDKDRAISISAERWQTFVEENLAFYSVFFTKMLHRLSRVDLCSVKNAIMLYRLTKVFSQTNFEKIITQVESLVDEKHSSVTWSKFATVSKGNLLASSNRSGLLSRSATEVGHAGLVRQHLTDFEGFSHTYVPMFGDEITDLVKQIIFQVEHSKVSLSYQRSSVITSKRPSLVIWLMSFFGIDSVDSLSMAFDDGSTTGGPRSEQYLDVVLKQLSSLYKIQVSQINEDHSLIHGSPDSYIEGPSMSDHIMDGEGRLTPHGRQQVLNRTCQPDVSYMGDPDLQPISSGEFGFLVRLLFQFASSINEKYGAEINDVYGRQDFVGRFCRQLLAGPTVSCAFQRHGTPSSQDVKLLPPRLSLRWLACKQNIGYLCIVFWFSYLNGYGLVLSLLAVLVTIGLYALYGALFEPYRKVIQK